MTTILLVADRQSVINHVHTTLAVPDIALVNHSDPETAAATAYANGVDAVIVDMQVGSMGAMAVTRAVRAAAGDDRAIPVTILLDRDADAFLARRAGAANWLLKNAPASQFRAAVSPTTSAPSTISTGYTPGDRDVAQHGSAHRSGR